MWLVSARDLLWRKRRFLIAVISASLVFSLTLVLDGLTHHISNEVSRVVDRFDADVWIVAPGESGPFTASTLLPATTAADVAALPGVTHAEAMIAARDTIDGKWVNVLGYDEGGNVETTSLTSGRMPTGPGETVVEDILDYRTGEVISIGGAPFEVVGVAHGLAYSFGAPTVLLPVGEVQRTLLGGQRLIGAVAVTGTPDRLPDGLRSMTSAAVEQDMHLGMDQSLQIVSILDALLWVIAAAIIASMVYLSTLERVRDFAVMKAIGVSNRSLRIGLAGSSLLLAVLAAIGGTILAFFLGPRFPMEVETPTSSYATLLAVAVVVGLAAGFIGLRKAVRVDPALAFGGA
jgi:putative ABC transport system permease protein